MAKGIWTMSQRVDVHQAITDRIIEAIERRAGEFNLPWHRPAVSISWPVNTQSRKGYPGTNVVTLWVEAQPKSYATSVSAAKESRSRWDDFRFRPVMAPTSFVLFVCIQRQRT
jgi:hypothetical protein